MTLRIFNPDHDLALASNLANFTSPHAGRQLRHDLDWLPALWTDSDSIVLVEDKERAGRAVRRRNVANYSFATARQLPTLDIDSIEPWGWNAALCAQLKRMGVDKRLLPSADELNTIRELSHRRTAARLLRQLSTDGTIGEAKECKSREDIVSMLETHQELVIKAPWSSSGRGLRFLSAAKDDLARHEGWIRNTLARQGSVMAEPRYHNVKDLGMEFTSDGLGNIRYEGLSLFHTSNGAYTGNILATEQAKMQCLTSRFISEELLLTVRDNICSTLGPMLKNKYQGPLGIDMMVVRCDSQDGRPLFMLHPCVEINLRRTMGHVALAAEHLYNPNGDDDLRYVMRIAYQNNKYKLLIRRL